MGLLHNSKDHNSGDPYIIIVIVSAVHKTTKLVSKVLIHLQCYHQRNSHIMHSSNSSCNSVYGISPYRLHPPLPFNTAVHHCHLVLLILQCLIYHVPRKADDHEAIQHSLEKPGELCYVRLYNIRLSQCAIFTTEA